MPGTWRLFFCTKLQSKPVAYSIRRWVLVYHSFPSRIWQKSLRVRSPCPLIVVRQSASFPWRYEDALYSLMMIRWILYERCLHAAYSFSRTGIICFFTHQPNEPTAVDQLSYRIVTGKASASQVIQESIFTSQIYTRILEWLLIGFSLAPSSLSVSRARALEKASYCGEYSASLAL